MTEWRQGVETMTMCMTRKIMTDPAVWDDRTGENALDDRTEEEASRIDGVARIRISDHIRECGMRYTETKESVAELKESIRRLHGRLDDAAKTRFTLLMAVIVAAVSGVFQIVLHFVPSVH